MVETRWTRVVWGAVRDAAVLVKWRISAASMLTVLPGYLLGGGTDAAWALRGAAGVLLIAFGASALNQVQEARLDARMERTADRPVPAGRIGRGPAAAAALGLAVAGAALLSPVPGAAGVGVATLVWYNGVYTPLKRITAFAAFPGGIVGALPPVIGWLWAGGDPRDYRILVTAFFFFVWQVPHFWLLLIRADADFARSGLPTVTRVFTRRQLGRVVAAWMLATAAAGVMAGAAGTAGSTAWVFPGFVGASVWLGWRALALLRGAGTAGAFRGINAFAVAVSVLLSAGGAAG